MPKSPRGQLESLMDYTKVDAWMAIGSMTKRECSAVIEELDAELAAGFWWQWRRQLRYLDPNRRMFLAFPERCIDDFLRVLHNLTTAPWRAFWVRDKQLWLHKELIRKAMQMDFYPPSEPDQSVQSPKQ